MLVYELKWERLYVEKVFKNPLTPVCTITVYCSDTHPPELHPTEQLLIHTNIPHGSANVTIQSVSNKTYHLCISVSSMCILSLFSSSALPPGTNGSCCVSLGLLFTCFPYCLDYSISTSLGVAVCFPNCIYACSAENWVGRGTHKSWMMSNHTPPSDRECPDRLTLFGLCWDCRRICTKTLN